MVFSLFFSILGGMSSTLQVFKTSLLDDQMNNYISNTLKHLRENDCRYWGSFNREQTTVTSCHNKQMHVQLNFFSWTQAKDNKREWGNLERFNLILPPKVDWKFGCFSELSGSLFLWFPLLNCVLLFHKYTSVLTYPAYFLIFCVS